MINFQIPAEMGVYKIRQLHENEFLLYKMLRLEAIAEEPSMFRCTLPAETALSENDWKERIKCPRAVFGLFENESPIGMTSIIALDAHIGYLGQSYIRKEYRGIGLSALLFKARMLWAAEMKIKRLTISHRESNLISKAANQRYGFKYSHRESASWQDGAQEDVLYYVLDM